MNELTFKELIDGKTFPQWLRVCRARRGWNIKQAARNIGINTDMLSRYEDGYRFPGLASLRAIYKTYCEEEGENVNGN